MTKLVFLDIDGVLDTYKSRYQLDPEQMAHLVLVNDEGGLTEADVEKAVGILNQTQDK